MRVFAVLLICALLASCDTMHPLWHKATPEELAEQEARERRDRADRLAIDRSIAAERRQREEEKQSRKAEERRRRAEQLKKFDAVIQVFSMADVAECKRLDLIRAVGLDDARFFALKIGGDRILSQQNKHLDAGLWRDDYEVYRCAAPPDLPIPAPKVTPPPVPEPPSAPPPESR